MRQRVEYGAPRRVAERVKDLIDGYAMFRQCSSCLPPMRRSTRRMAVIRLKRSYSDRAAVMRSSILRQPSSRILGPSEPS
jgi:hypothetical protein